jgi:hypothetical protein
MNGRCTNAASLMTAIELYGKENIGCFGPAVGHEGVVVSPFKVGIVEIDIGKPMSGRGQVYEPTSWFHQRSNAIDENEVSQVIGAELRFEAVCGVSERSRHHACIGNDYVERPTVGHQPICACADAFQVSQIEFDQFKASALRGSLCLDLSCGRLRFFQIASSAYYLCSMRGEGSRGFHAEASGYAGYEDSLSIQSNAIEHVFRG